MGRLVSENLYDLGNGYQLERCGQNTIKLLNEYGGMENKYIRGSSPQFEVCELVFRETPEQKREREYLCNKGHTCLYCGSVAINSNDMVWDEPLSVEVNCDDCEKTWTDTYTLTGVIEDESD